MNNCLRFSVLSKAHNYNQQTKTTTQVYSYPLSSNVWHHTHKSHTLTQASFSKWMLLSLIKCHITLNKHIIRAIDSHWNNAHKNRIAFFFSIYVIRTGMVLVHFEVFSIMYAMCLCANLKSLMIITVHIYWYDFLMTFVLRLILFVYHSHGLIG